MVELGPGGSSQSGTIEFTNAVPERRFEVGFAVGDPCALRISCRRDRMELKGFMVEAECVCPGPDETLDLGDLVVRPVAARLGGVVLRASGEPVVSQWPGLLCIWSRWSQSSTIS